ncbi:MAG TPA: glycosyltransferase family 2 protein [Spirochaetales bacterium]|nr:glycosyltransferase family 2 protein [Spirochaetales bacterium]HRY53126.1 glycosyltransferase family 2 protein [Spirochaetia bacterium]
MVGTLSIVVVTYNQENTIAGTLDSAASVRAPGLELIVCDDASRDGTRAAIEAWRERLPESGPSVRCLFHPQNLGVRGNVLSGCEAAGGEYVKVIGGDDLLIPEGLAAMFEWLRSSRLRVAFGRPFFDIEDPAFSSDDERKRERYRAFSAMPAPTQLIKQLQCNRVFAPSAVFERALLLEHMRKIEAYSMLDDWPLWLSISRSGVHIEYFDTPIVRYRVHAGSLSRSTKASATRIAYQRDLARLMAACEREMPRRLVRERVQMRLDHIRLAKENGLLDPGARRASVLALKAARKILSLGRPRDI